MAEGKTLAEVCQLNEDEQDSSGSWLLPTFDLSLNFCQQAKPTGCPG
jgi:hypothetical protein